MDERPIIFEDWERFLRETVPPEVYRAYREAIVKFRYWLRETGKAPGVETFKERQRDRQEWR